MLLTPPHVMTGLLTVVCIVIFVGAPWSTQAVVEWMVSVQLELLRSGRSKRMTEQLSDKAITKVASADSVDLNANGNGNAPSGLVKKGTSVEQRSQ